MGQQQLLLLVIGVVLVGVAIVAGFYAFNTKTRQFVADNLIERNLEIATDAVFWKTKRDPYDGGNAKYTGLADGNGMQKLFLGQTTPSGCFQITSATANALTIEARSRRFPDEVGARTYVRGYRIDSTRVFYNGEVDISCD